MSMVNGVQVYREGPLVFTPGQTSEVSLVVQNQGDGTARVEHVEHVPEGWLATPEPRLEPQDLPPGAKAQVAFKLKAPQAEGPALLNGTCTVERGGVKESQRIETPIACYPPHPIDAPERLVDVRDRLVAVTNFHPRNGHELMIDPCEYFAERLNVPLSKPLQRLVANEFSFPQADLPVDRDRLIALRRGNLKGVLGVDHVWLDADWDDPCDTLQELRSAAAYPREVNE